MRTQCAPTVTTPSTSQAGFRVGPAPPEPNSCLRDKQPEDGSASSRALRSASAACMRARGPLRTGCGRASARDRSRRGGANRRRLCASRHRTDRRPQRGRHHRRGPPSSATTRLLRPSAGQAASVRLAGSTVAQAVPESTMASKRPYGTAAVRTGEAGRQNVRLDETSRRKRR
jgi:hypothetical protein